MAIQRPSEGSVWPTHSYVIGYGGKRVANAIPLVAYTKATRYPSIPTHQHRELVSRPTRCPFVAYSMPCLGLPNALWWPTQSSVVANAMPARQDGDPLW
jgi:hypothetical protein